MRYLTVWAGLVQLRPDLTQLRMGQAEGRLSTEPACVFLCRLQSTQTILTCYRKDRLINITTPAYRTLTYIFVHTALRKYSPPFFTVCSVTWNQNYIINELIYTIHLTFKKCKTPYIFINELIKLDV